MTNKLEKCMFCASSETKLDIDQESAGKRYNPRCLECHASGGWFRTWGDAVETWNNASEAVERTRD